MILLDLAEAPVLMRTGLLSAGRFATRGFLRSDHFGDPREPLEKSVRGLVQMQTGLPVEGPIRLLTQLRSFGCYFSPLNLFFCFGGDGHTIQAIVAEVQNTPWLERHCYVLWDGNQDGSGIPGSYRHRKAFHVSPFMGMDVDYRWRLSLPGVQLQVGIEDVTRDNVLFRAALQLRRSPLSRRTLFGMQCRYPVSAIRIMAAIYLQAFQLWRKKCPYYPHPKHGPQNAMLPSSIESPILESSTVAAGKF